MKITSNVIGNYSINSNADKIALKKKAGLNAAEKEFFINKYPDKKDEITDYHFYQKSGKMSGVQLGQTFDRKG